MKSSVVRGAAASPGWAALRAGQWVHFVALPLATVTPGAEEPRALALRAGRGMAVAALALAYAYGANAVADRGTDEDPRKNPLVGTSTFPSAAVAASVVAAMAALALAAVGGHVALVATVASLLAASVYSLGPRLKARPFAGTLVNLAIFAPLLLASAPHPWAQPPALPFLAFVFAAMLLQNQLLHEQADASEDAAAGVRTTARVLGTRGTKAAIVLLGLLGVLGAVWTAPGRVCVIAAVLVLMTGGAAGLGGRDSWAARRRLHRAIAFAGGALLFVLSWSAS